MWMLLVYFGLPDLHPAEPHAKEAHESSISLQRAGHVAGRAGSHRTGLQPLWPGHPIPDGATPAASPTAALLPTETVAATTTPPPVEQSSPTPAACRTPAGEAIELSATGGNLNLRRDPGQAYDIVGLLFNGQASPASGRNEPISWVYLAVPNTPGASGWVSVDSRYVSLAPSAGAVQPLPVLSFDPPKLAYLRN